MAKKLASTKGMSREEWLDIRRQGIGGSDAASILGINPWSSAYILYHEKLGDTDEKPDTEAMRIGRDLEQYCAERFAEATGKKVQRTNFVWQSDEHPFMLANIDRVIVGENAALECKTASSRTSCDYKHGEIPDNYLCQMMHYMAVMGYTHMYLAVLVMGEGFYWFKVDRDEEDIRLLINAEEEFWTHHVLTHEPPEIDGSDATLGFIKRTQGKSASGFERTITIEEESLLHQIDEVKSDISILKDRQNALESKLMLSLGDAEKVTGTGVTITYKTQVRETVSGAKLKAADKALYEKLKTVSESRPLKITYKKAKEN